MSLSQRLQSKNNLGDQENISVPDNKPVPEEKVDKYAALKLKIHKEVIEKIDREIKQADLNEAALTQKTREIVNSILEREAGFLPYSERQMIAAVVNDEVLGMGPLEPLLNDNDITEIMVNGPKQIYVERKGRLELSEAVFRDDEHVLHIIDKIVSPIG